MESGEPRWWTTRSRLTAGPPPPPRHPRSGPCRRVNPPTRCRCIPRGSVAFVRSTYVPAAAGPRPTSETHGFAARSAGLPCSPSRFPPNHQSRPARPARSAQARLVCRVVSPAASWPRVARGSRKPEAVACQF